MNKLFTLVLLGAVSIAAHAQTAPTTQPFGKVDQADLEMKECGFEKGAGAEVLFDKGHIYHYGNVDVLERHTRIKILNNFGRDAANVRLEYISYMGSSSINDLQAQTINLENGKVEITLLDKKLIFKETTDKFFSALVFALPKVKTGSIIEFKYSYALVNGYFPTWYFQSRFPTRYSEIRIDMPASIFNRFYKLIPHVKLPYVVNIGKIDDYKQVKALANIHSLSDEPYMGSRLDNLERVEYSVTSAQVESWDKIGKILIRDSEVGDQYDRNLADEDIIIKHAKSLKCADEKIAFIFDTVKHSMKWNQLLRFYTTDGTVRAWNKKTGNSAEINFILYHLLKKAGINAMPMIVSTKAHGKINPYNPNINLFNSAVVYIPVDSTKYYVLDATNKFNLFNTIPTDELNTYGLKLDEGNQIYNTVFMSKEEPIVQSIFLNAEIKPEGKVDGAVEITSDSYNKINAVNKYKTDGEEKYINYLKNDDNNIKISALKLENMLVDSLPLSQKFNFDIDLTGSDKNYIYFNTSIFNLIGGNPFINAERFSDIDFGYRDNYLINAMCKIPAGYKIESLPKNITIMMPDSSIVFKRSISQEEGIIAVRYTINHLKTIFFREDYPDIRGFYKKMYDLLNEQTVLKKQ